MTEKSKLTYEKLIINLTREGSQVKYICFEIFCDMKENDEYYYILSQYSNNKMEKLYKS